MDWPGFIGQLLPLLFLDQVDARSLIELIGEPAEKSDRLWRIDPVNFSQAIREAHISIENLPSGTVDIIALDIDLVEPWRVSLEALSSAFSCTLRRVPTAPVMLKPGVPHRRRPRTFAWDIKRDSKRVVVMFTGRPVDVDPSSDIDVVEISVSRTRR